MQRLPAGLGMWLEGTVCLEKPSLRLQGKCTASCRRCFFWSSDTWLSRKKQHNPAHSTVALHKVCSRPSECPQRNPQPPTGAASLRSPTDGFLYACRRFQALQQQRAPAPHSLPQALLPGDFPLPAQQALLLKLRLDPGLHGHVANPPGPLLALVTRCCTVLLAACRPARAFPGCGCSHGLHCSWLPALCRAWVLVCAAFGMFASLQATRDWSHERVAV